MTRATSKIRCLALCGTLLGGGGQRAHAQATVAPVDPEAQRLYEEGLAHFRRGEYAPAVASLGASYRLTPAPDLLYDIAQAHRLNQDCTKALAFYRAYLDTGPTGFTRERAAERIPEMESCAAARAVAAGAPVRAPPAAAAEAPLGAADPPLSAAAPPLLAAEAGRLGHDAGGASPSRPRRHRRAAYALGATAAVLASLSGYFAWQAAEASDRVSAAFLPGMTWGPADMEAQRRGQLSTTLEIASLAGALVSAGVAGWLALRD